MVVDWFLQVTDDELEGPRRWKRQGRLRLGVTAWVLEGPHKDLEGQVR